MSTVYLTNYKYKYFIDNIKDIEIRNPIDPIYIVSHIGLTKNGNSIFAFESNEAYDEVQHGTLLFERYGANNPTEIFNLIILQFPGLKIIDEDNRLNWPECGV